MPVGEPFMAQVMNWCWNGVGMHLASRRTPHTMGVTTRVYHKDGCDGGHIDFWVPDNYCGDGTVFSRDSRSFVANCENDYVVEYDHEGCMGMSTYHALHEIDLGVCHTTRQGTYEVVCGGMPVPILTGSPTMVPTSLPTMISSNDTADYITMVNRVWYNGSVASGQIVRYSFIWKPEMIRNGANMSIIVLRTISGDAYLRVYFYNPTLNSICDVGTYPCVHSSASNDWGYSGDFLNDDVNFLAYCLSGGCQILIGVYGPTDSVFEIRVRAG
jgi:hypothetical protein